MTGMILDGILMLLLVAALGYGVRLEKKLSALRAGQLAFASAVSDLNTAAGRAEAALASLRASGQETDLLHDRIIKAREVKAQLEALIVRGGEYAPARASEAAPRPEARPVATAPAHAPRPFVAPTPAPVSEDDARAARMQALAERIQGLAAPSRAPAPNNVHAILGAITANQSAKQSLNQARRSLDDDLFAA
jgi:hypothetical protein